MSSEKKPTVDVKGGEDKERKPRPPRRKSSNKPKPQGALSSSSPAEVPPPSAPPEPTPPDAPEPTIELVTEGVAKASLEEEVEEKEDTTETPPEEASAEKRKTTPYVNPERVKTGGQQRDKLTDEELAERMARIKAQNDKIKQRRLDIQADEEAFKKTQEEERLKTARTRKIQSDIDKARDANAQRKLDKVQAREWDSGKPTGRGGGRGRGPPPPTAE